LIFNKLFQIIKLPGLLGMLILGILIGPYVLNWISLDVMTISGDLRKIALIVILLRAGFGIKKETLNRVGKTAFKLSFIPGILEGTTILLLSMWIFGFSFSEGGMLGFIIAAVSPAVVVPLMINFMDRGMGAEKGIPTLILAGASIDDIVAITIFSTFLGLYGGGNINIPMTIGSIPISILLGIGIGILTGFILIFIFKKIHIRDTKKVLMILSIAIILTTIEGVMDKWIQIASLLGVMTMAFIMLEKIPVVARRLSKKFEKIWVFAEIMLFVLIGAQVNIYVAFNAGLIGLFIVSIGLISRSFGVFISIRGMNLNKGEKIFAIVSYLPKATVQAAIGAIPLMAGVEHGELILAISVLSIIFTAPLGAIAIKITGNKYLSKT